MRRWLVLLVVLGFSTPAWADPADELKACQAQTAALTVQAQQARNARIGYVAKLGEMLAELREQLDQAREQIQALSQEVLRHKAPKLEEKK